MKIPITHPNETVKETVAYIDANRSTGKDLRVSLSLCKIYQRGEYIILEYDKKVYYWEMLGRFCYLEDAIYYINPEKKRKWKTLDRLITFRQAIRENSAQCMNLDDYLDENISYKAFKDFLSLARHYDEIHHGQVTF